MDRICVSFVRPVVSLHCNLQGVYYTESRQRTAGCTPYLSHNYLTNPNGVFPMVQPPMQKQLTFSF